MWELLILWKELLYLRYQLCTNTSITCENVLILLKKLVYLTRISCVLIPILPLKMYSYQLCTNTSITCENVFILLLYLRHISCVLIIVQVRVFSEKTDILQQLISVFLLLWPWKLGQSHQNLTVLCYVPLYIHENLVRVRPLVHKILCSVMQMPMGSAPKSICPPPLWLGDNITCEDVFVCVEVLPPSQPNGVMSSVVSLPNHTFTGQA